MYTQLIFRGMDSLRKGSEGNSRTCKLKRSNAMYRQNYRRRKPMQLSKKRSTKIKKSVTAESEQLLLLIENESAVQCENDSDLVFNNNEVTKVEQQKLKCIIDKSINFINENQTVWSTKDPHRVSRQENFDSTISWIRLIKKRKHRRIYPYIPSGIQEVDDSFFERFGSLLREQTESAQAREEAEADTITGQAAAALTDAETLFASEDAAAGQTRKISSVSTVSERSDEEGAAGSEANASSFISSDSDGDDKDKEDYIAVAWNIEELYCTVVYNILHNVGCDVAVEVGQNALFVYVQDAFKLSNERHAAIMAVAEKREPPEILLNVEIIEAKDLRPKDSNGLSDPFVTLFLSSNSSHRYNTSVKGGTLSPVWEEHFALPVLDNSQDDTLCLEVWDFDPAESVREKFGKIFAVKGVKGVRKLFKEIAVTAATGQHNNELIGRARIPLKAIPASGMTMWYSLDKKNKVTRQGVVKVRLTFSSEKNCQVAAQEHRQLLRMLLLHELESSKVAEFWWSGSFSVQGEALLTQHIAQSGLNPTDVNLAKWAVYCSTHAGHPLNLHLFVSLLDKLLRPIQAGTCCPEDVKIFWEAARRLLPSCYGIIRKLRRKCQKTSEKKQMKQLLDVLGILARLASLAVPETNELFPEHSYVWMKQLPTAAAQPSAGPLTVMSVLSSAVIYGALDWFNHLYDNNSVKGNEHESEIKRLQTLIQIVQLVRTDIQKAIEFYNKKFNEITNLQYARILYIYYQERLASVAEPEINTICQSMKKLSFTRDRQSEADSTQALNAGTTLFELYLVLQRFVTMGATLCPLDHESLPIANFHGWFHKGVAQWLDIAVFKALQRIQKAVELDNLVPVSPDVKYSSSAVDALTIFYQIKVFWEQLNWPDVESCYTFIAKIIDDICRCSVFYADQMSTRVDNTITPTLPSLLSSQPKFEVTQEWCLAINNIDYVRQSLLPFTEDLGMDAVIQRLGDLRSHVEAQRCQQTLDTVIANAVDTVRNKIVELLEIVAEKMCPAMKRLLVEGAELLQQDSNSIDRLMMYIDGNLATLHQELNADNFNRTLDILWEDLGRMLADIIQCNLEKRRPPSFFANLHETLKIMVKAFKQSEDDTATECSELKRTEELLRLNGLETPDLIHEVYIEFCNEQKSIGESNLGQLTVKLKFHKDNLAVEVVNARNLPAMDSNGSCDPFVRVHLLPEEKFTNVTKPKTQTYSKNQFPLYDEKFEINLSSSQRHLKDGIVLFSVKDYDLMGYNNQYIGEAFIPFNDIPESADLIEKLPQLHLHLFRPSNLNTAAIKALEYRQGDKQAKEFLKKLKQKAGTTNGAS